MRQATFWTRGGRGLSPLIRHILLHYLFGKGLLFRHSSLCDVHTSTRYMVFPQSLSPDCPSWLCTCSGLPRRSSSKLQLIKPPPWPTGRTHGRSLWWVLARLRPEEDSRCGMPPKSSHLEQKSRRRVFPAKLYFRVLWCLTLQVMRSGYPSHGSISYQSTRRLRISCVLPPSAVPIHGHSGSWVLYMGNCVCL